MIIKSESITKIANGLIGFQAEIAKIKKTQTNPFFKSKYASLSDVLDGIKEPLHNNRLTFTQFPTGENEMTTLLMHESGEFIQGTFKMTPAKNDPQGQGSVITYQRRYALGAILGLNIDDDDDGNAASLPVSNPVLREKTEFEKQVESETDLDRLAKMKVKTLESKYRPSQKNRMLAIVDERIKEIQSGGTVQANPVGRREERHANNFSPEDESQD